MTIRQLRQLLFEYDDQEQEVLVQINGTNMARPLQLLEPAEAQQVLKGVEIYKVLDADADDEEEGKEIKQVVLLRY